MPTSVGLCTRNRFINKTIKINMKNFTNIQEAEKYLMMHHDNIGNYDTFENVIEIHKIQLIDNRRYEYIYPKWLNIEFYVGSTPFYFKYGVIFKDILSMKDFCKVNRRGEVAYTTVGSSTATPKFRVHNVATYYQQSAVYSPDSTNLTEDEYKMKMKEIYNDYVEIKERKEKERIEYQNKQQLINSRKVPKKELLNFFSKTRLVKERNWSETMLRLLPEEADGYHYMQYCGYYELYSCERIEKIEAEIKEVGSGKYLLMHTELLSKDNKQQ